jgi:hypothetical protein
VLLPEPGYMVILEQNYPTNMKTVYTAIICSLLSANIIAQSIIEKEGFYPLIEKAETIPGTINWASINKLSEPLRAIAAYYAAMQGSGCLGDTCGLTSALGLGWQGSSAHQGIIEQWFKGDKTAKELLAQNCYLPPNTSSSFSDYVFLELIQKGNEVQVRYKVMFYFHGKTSYISSKNDLFEIVGNTIFVRKKAMWKS